MNTERTETHYPANGARVVVGWVDTATGQRWLDDMPVLWFNDQYDPVTTPSADDPMTGAESLRVIGNLRWVVYHPEARRIGGYVFGHYEAAVQTVNDALDRYLKEQAA